MISSDDCFMTSEIKFIQVSISNRNIIKTLWPPGRSTYRSNTFPIYFLHYFWLHVVSINFFLITVSALSKLTSLDHVSCWSPCKCFDLETIILNPKINKHTTYLVVGKLRLKAMIFTLLRGVQTMYRYLDFLRWTKRSCSVKTWSTFFI